MCSCIPNSGIIQASANNVTCGNSVELLLNGRTAMQNITYQWQRNTGSGWTNFGSDTDALESPVITQTTQLHVQAQEVAQLLLLPLL